MPDAVVINQPTLSVQVSQDRVRPVAAADQCDVGGRRQEEGAVGVASRSTASTSRTGRSGRVPSVTTQL